MTWTLRADLDGASVALKGFDREGNDWMRVDLGMSRGVYADANDGNVVG